MINQIRNWQPLAFWVMRLLSTALASMVHPSAFYLSISFHSNVVHRDNSCSKYCCRRFNLKLKAVKPPPRRSLTKELVLTVLLSLVKGSLKWQLRNLSFFKQLSPLMGWHTLPNPLLCWFSIILFQARQRQRCFIWLFLSIHIELHHLEYWCDGFCTNKSSILSQ